MKKIISLILAMALMLSVMPVLPAAAAETETTPPVETTASTEAATVPTEAATAPTEAATVPTEAATAPTEEATAPAEETASTEAATVPTEAATAPTEAATEPAEEPTAPTEETTENPTEQTIVTDEYGNISFQTFEDFKYLLSQPQEMSPQTYFYAGEGPLVIAESITLPGGRSLHTFYADGEIIVPEGVTFTVSSTIGMGALQVDGVVNLVGWGSTILVTKSLTVSGSIECGGQIVFQNKVEVTGIENIHRSGEGEIVQHYSVRDMDGWRDAISSVPEYLDSFTVGVSGDITLEESAVLDGKVGLSVDPGRTLRIPAGCTLELDGGPWGGYSCHGSIIVEGALVNNSELTVGQGAAVEISGGTYSGSGTLVVECNEEADIPSMLPGFDLSKFKASQSGSWWFLVSTEGKTQLGTPTELKWGYRLGWQWDESAGAGKPVLVEAPGYLSWKPTEPYQGQVRIQIFKQGEAEEVSGTWIDYGSTDMPEYMDNECFVMNSDALDSGTYYFTVTQKADGTEYYDGETAVSETWTYTKPDAKLGACGNLAWNWPRFSATVPENAEGIEFRFYFSPTGNQEDAVQCNFGSTNRYVGPDGTSSGEVWDDIIQQYGTGYYYFKVRALSPDITKCQHGPWSELSSAYNLTEITQRVETQLDTLIQDDTKSADEIKQSVQDMDTQKLKDAMLADLIGNGAVAKIQALEEKAGTKTVVEVTEQAAAFDQSKVTVIGAGLNDVQNESEDIKLILDKPEKEHVLPAQYNNAVAVSFSMDLDNVQKTEKNELEVPVKITLPVPSTINPDFLAILHYHPDGSYEEIFPQIYVDREGYYASFVLTSFSDFVMVLEASITLGDLNGDGKIAALDAAMIYAAVNNKKVLTDAEFKAADVDGNGKIQAKDASMVYARVNNKLEKFPAEK